jgi:hypothetical protein
MAKEARGIERYCAPLLTKVAVNKVRYKKPSLVIFSFLKINPKGIKKIKMTNGVIRK